MIRSAKNFFENLNTLNQKQFWKTVKLLAGQKSSIPTLFSDSGKLLNNSEKAQAFSAFFAKCYDQEVPPIQSCYSPPSDLCDDDLLCVEEV